MRRFFLTGCVLTVCGALLWAKANNEQPSGLSMKIAAESFLAQLTEEQQKQASFAYDDPERLNWHFIPRERKGLPLRDIDGDALKAAHRFINSGLSTAGYAQTINVMSLEEVLYLLEGGERDVRRERRDPKKYYLSIFGTPTDKGTWGWRLEGHHISLNYTITDGEVVASTPEFFGANPGTIDAGLNRQIRVLGPEEDIARQVLKLCSSEQLKVAYIDEKPPEEVRTPGEVQPSIDDAVGLTYAKMSKDQQALLVELLNEYLKNMPGDIEKRRRMEIDAAGLGAIHFAWWGGKELNEPHNYRVQGPTFLIEYNNTQNNANHVHSMWRDMAGDFNIPISK
ncbi:MAG: DUF3500 domain-containing protein [Planctomycetota bacterium]|nr:DUF3500 domain-containing protein [Planctomycetota bacterium]